MRFLFRLDLSLYAGAGKKFGILIFGTEHGLGLSSGAGSQGRQPSSMGIGEEASARRAKGRHIHCLIAASVSLKLAVAAAVRAEAS
jgi:hypothetical protein